MYATHGLCCCHSQELPLCRWRFGRRWRAEQAKQLDPNYGQEPDDEDTWDAALGCVDFLRPRQDTPGWQPFTCACKCGQVRQPSAGRASNLAFTRPSGMQPNITTSLTVHVIMARACRYMDACGAGYHLQIARTTSVDKSLGHSIMGSSQMLLDDSFLNDVRSRSLDWPFVLTDLRNHAAARLVASQPLEARGSACRALTSGCVARH